MWFLEGNRILAISATPQNPPKGGFFYWFKKFYKKLFIALFHSKSMFLEQFHHDNDIIEIKINKRRCFLWD